MACMLVGNKGRVESLCKEVSDGQTYTEKYGKDFPDPNRISVLIMDARFEEQTP